MNTVKATPEHVDEARRWLRARGIDAPRELFSSTGYVVPGLAGLWLYLTNSRLGYLECLVGNPEAPADARGVALDAVIVRAIDEARAHGVSVLMAPTMSERVEERAARHGFAVTPVRSVLSLAIHPEVR